MKADFPRVLSLLRKERGISQKQAAGDLGVSQALLSHYEKGIRECGLDFLVRCADYYDVSCDYLLGRSPDRAGSKLTVEDIPEPDSLGKENVMGKGGVLPVLNKKLIANSLNILFDLLAKSKNKALLTEVSSFLMLAVYRMFRVVYTVNPRNQEGLFTVPKQVSSSYADATMQLCEAHAQAIAMRSPVLDMEEVESVEELAITTEQLGVNYPLFSSSLLNLIQNSEDRIATLAQGKKF